MELKNNSMESIPIAKSYHSFQNYLLDTCYYSINCKHYVDIETFYHMNPFRFISQFVQCSTYSF